MFGKKEPETRVCQYAGCGNVAQLSLCIREREMYFADVQVCYLHFWQYINRNPRLRKGSKEKDGLFEKL